MTSPKSDSKPSAADARNQLERVLANPAFMANARRKALLRHLVEEGLAGRAEKLKGFAIAVAIFDRDGRFDAQTDPVVRLEARRLRRDLDIYYGTAGADDPVRITIPKGAYVPCFEWQPVGKGAVAPILPTRRERLWRRPLRRPTMHAASHPSAAFAIWSSRPWSGSR